MECLLGIAFRDFVLIAADMTNAHSIMVMKDGKFESFYNVSASILVECSDVTDFRFPGVLFLMCYELGVVVE
jgi:20S proteasome subunit beta 4